MNRSWSKSMFEYFFVKFPTKEENLPAGEDAQVCMLDLEHTDRKENIFRGNIHELDGEKAAKFPEKRESSLIGGTAQFHLGPEYLISQSNIFTGDDRHSIKDNENLKVSEEAVDEQHGNQRGLVEEDNSSIEDSEFGDLKSRSSGSGGAENVKGAPAALDPIISEYRCKYTLSQHHKSKKNEKYFLL